MLSCFDHNFVLTRYHWFCFSIEAERLREDLRQITMHYESKCEDYKLLEERLSRTKQEYQTHITQLQKR